MTIMQRHVLVFTTALLCAVLLVAPGLALEPATAEAETDVDTDMILDGGERDVQETIWFQGFLADVDTGDPINGSMTIGARLYAQPTGGSILWGTELHVGTTISEGWFEIELGSIEALPDFDDPPYYLEITADSETMDARQKLASVPSAFAWRGSVVDQLAVYESGIKLVGGDVERRVSAADNNRHWLLLEDGFYIYDPVSNDQSVGLEGGTAGQLHLERVDNSSGVMMSASADGGELQISSASGSLIAWLRGDGGHHELAGPLDLTDRLGVGASASDARLLVDEVGEARALHVEQHSVACTQTVMIDRTEPPRVLRRLCYVTPATMAAPSCLL